MSLSTDSLRLFADFFKKIRLSADKKQLPVGEVIFQPISRFHVRSLRQHGNSEIIPQSQHTQRIIYPSQSEKRVPVLLVKNADYRIFSAFVGSRGFCKNKNKGEADTREAQNKKDYAKNNFIHNKAPHTIIWDAFYYVRVSL